MEAKLFTESPEGIKIHWQVEGDSVDALVEKAFDLLNRLNANQFRGDAGFGKSTVTAPRQDDSVPFDDPRQYNGPAPSQRPQQASSLGPAPQCGKCGGDMWDNRTKKANKEGHFHAKSPDFSCKDKQGCGANAWIQPGGGLKWTQPAL